MVEVHIDGDTCYCGGGGGGGVWVFMKCVLTCLGFRVPTCVAIALKSGFPFFPFVPYKRNACSKRACSSGAQNIEAIRGGA